MERAIAGSRYVFHIALRIKWKECRSGNRRRYTERRRGGDRRQALNAVVVVSTTTVFGHNRTAGVVDENSPYRPDLGEYPVESKAEAEKYCLNRARTFSATPESSFWILCRFMDLGDHLFTVPFRAARSGAFCWIEHGRGKLNFTYVDNVVDALVLAAQCRGRPRSTVHHQRRYVHRSGFFDPAPWGIGRQRSAPARATSCSREIGRIEPRSGLLTALSSDEVVGVVNRTPVLRKLRTFASEHFEVGAIQNAQSRRGRPNRAQARSLPPRCRGHPHGWPTFLARWRLNALRRRRGLSWAGPRLSIWAKDSGAPSPGCVSLACWNR